MMKRKYSIPSSMMKFVILASFPPTPSQSWGDSCDATRIADLVLQSEMRKMWRDNRFSGLVLGLFQIWKLSYCKLCF